MKKLSGAYWLDADTINALVPVMDVLYRGEPLTRDEMRHLAQQVAFVFHHAEYLPEENVP